MMDLDPIKFLVNVPSNFKNIFFYKIRSKMSMGEKILGDINGFKSVQWRIHIVKFWTPPPSGSKFFQLHAVFGEIWQNRMLVPPPRGNPGSATALS